MQLHLDDAYPQKLSQWALFTGKLQPNQGVLVYQVNTPLFSDYADKFRTVWMPHGEAARYDANGVFEFPVGTIFSKTFSFGDRLIETRLLVRMSNGWVGLPYVWMKSRPRPCSKRHPSPCRSAGRIRSSSTPFPM